MSKIIYDVYQNKNENNAAYGKYFGRIVHTETLNTRKLAKHISEHGSVYTQDVVEGVLTKAESCILEMLLESKKVKLEGLGTFYLMAENKKGGAVSIDKFNPKGTFSGLHIRFLPDLSGEAQLNSKDMLQKATFMWAEDLKRESAEARPTPPSNGDDTGSVDNSGSQNEGGNSGSQSNEGGSQSGNGGNTNSGSNTGGSTGGNTSGDGQQTTYNLTIARSGSGTSTVTDDSENVITGQRRFAPGTNLNIEIVPAEGQIPTARLNYNPIELTENDGTYTGSFQMPAQGSVLELNSGSNGSNGDDDYSPINDD